MASKKKRTLSDDHSPAKESNKKKAKASATKKGKAAAAAVRKKASQDKLPTKSTRAAASKEVDSAVSPNREIKKSKRSAASKKTDSAVSPARIARAAAEAQESEDHDSQDEVTNKNDDESISSVTKSVQSGELSDGAGVLKNPPESVAEAAVLPTSTLKNADNNAMTMETIETGDPESPGHVDNASKDDPTETSQMQKGQVPNTPTTQPSIGRQNYSASKQTPVRKASALAKAWKSVETNCKTVNCEINNTMWLFLWPCYVNKKKELVIANVDCNWGTWKKHVGDEITCNIIINAHGDKTKTHEPRAGHDMAAFLAHVYKVSASSHHSCHSLGCLLMSNP